jgi:putative methyltransferase (TIGR04325 family)
MNLKAFIRNLCPPILWRLGTWLKRRPDLPTAQPKRAIRFFGDWSSWEAAVAASDGYANANILERTRAALLKVQGGEAVYERDSFLMDRPEYSFPVIAALLRIAVVASRLSVIDFGGSLGSSYFQFRSFLSGVGDLRWSVVEQPAHVACGKADFANAQLRFYDSIDQCLEAERPNVLLLSGVIQYLPDPYGFIDNVVARGFDFLIIDRTPFLSRGVTRLTVQQVPDWIYQASYPCWFLSEERFLSSIKPVYKLVANFPALDSNQPDGDIAYYKGFIFDKLTRQ